MAEVKVYFDRQGQTLTVWFTDRRNEYVCEQTGDEVVLMKDASGRVLGFVEREGRARKPRYQRPVALVGLPLVAQCSTKGVDTQSAQAARAEEAAFNAAVPVPDGVYQVGDTGVSPPTLVRSAYAGYTSEAFRSRVRGSVILRAIVDPNGGVSDVRILRSLEASLDVAASKALAQWEFRPGTRYGEPVPVAVVVRMAFTMP